MSDLDRVSGVLVTGIPGLLAPGRCGAVPPRVKQQAGRWAEHHGQYEPLVHAFALPVWWGGELVHEGYDRIRRAMEGLVPRNPGLRLSAVIRLARNTAEHLWGRVVLVDSHGFPVPEVLDAEGGDAGAEIESSDEADEVAPPRTVCTRHPWTYDCEKSETKFHYCVNPPGHSGPCRCVCCGDEGQSKVETQEQWWRVAAAYLHVLATSREEAARITGRGVNEVVPADGPG